MKLISALFLLATTACVHTQVVPFVPVSELASSPPRNPTAVAIYRTEKPLQNTKELGLITFSSSTFSMPEFYEILRTEAAKHGADAVYDVKVKSETHKERDTVQHCKTENDCSGGECNPRQVCRDETETKDVTTYTVTGSLIRRM